MQPSKLCNTACVCVCVCVGSWRDKMWPDGWTAVTEDGKRSAQFEHQLLITKDGCEVLTARTADSPKLWWEV